VKKLLAALSIASTFLFSCQKEIGTEVVSGGGTTGGTSGTKLLRIGTRLGTDSVTTNYSYDGTGRLTAYTQDGTINGQPADIQINLVRNPSGIITSTVIKSSLFAGLGFDEVLTDYIYDAAASRYKYAKTTVTAFGDTYTDSVVYTYDAMGNLASAVDWEDDGTGYVPYTKEEYTYAGSNLASLKSFTFNDFTSSYDLDAASSFEYDTKISPLKQTRNDAVVLGVSLFHSANNQVKADIVTTDPPTTSVKNVVYTYNNSNLPTKGVSTTGSLVSTNSYYYQ